MAFSIILMSVILSVDATFTTEMPSNTSAPVFTQCPGKISVSILTNQDTKEAYWDEPVVEHAYNVQSNYHSGDQFPIGNRQVVYTATGFNNSVEQCIFVVSVSDYQPPVFVNCNMTINIELATDVHTLAVDWTPPTAIDNSDFSGTVTTTSARSPGDTFQYGSTTVTYYATDQYCNEGSCDLTFNLFWPNFDYATPTVNNCPSDMEVLINDPSSTAVVSWTPPTANMSASHPEPDVTSNMEPGDAFPLGITIVEYVFSVTSSSITRYSLCAFTVRVLDRYPTQLIEKVNPDPAPTIQGLWYATVTWQTPVFEDQRPFTVSTSHPNPIGDFEIGTTNINYNTDEGDCNTADASATIVITVYDWEDPDISSCPQNKTGEADAGLNRKRVYYSTPEIFDNSRSYTESWSKKSGTWFYIGVTEVTLTVNDPSGNNDQCSFHVKIYDYQPPTMVCPDKTVSTSPGLATGTALFSQLDITDNSQLPVDQVFSHASGSVFPLGSTSVLVNGTDAFGNFADCTFQIQVIDTEAPVFTGCPSDIEALADLHVNTHNVSWDPPTATDNTDPNPVVTADTDPGILFVIGNNPVTYTATDIYDNENTCSFYVIIIDDQPPIITNCPGNQTISTDHRMPTGATTWADATLFDNSFRTIDVEWSIAKGSAFHIGTTPVILTARDESGNEASCGFQIHVYDDEPPVLTCPDVTVANDYRLPSAVVNWEDPGATDNSGLQVTLTPSIPLGSTFNLGDTVIYYNGTDPFGNREDCSFVLTVEDRESPYFTYCPDDISDSADRGERTRSISWSDPTVEDNSGSSPYVFSNYNPGDYFEIGITTVLYKATDNENNPNETCSFDIEIIDDQPPIIENCPGNQTISTDHRMPTAVTTWLDATFYDNSLREIQFWWSIPKDSAFDIGTTQVILTARDESGNEETCDFYIHVYDPEPPVLICPDVTVPNDYRLPSAVVSWPNPVVTDNSGLDVSLTTAISSGSTFDIGDAIVHYNGTDPFGNVGNCSFVVTVKDTESPFFTFCPNDTVQSSDLRERTTSVTWQDPVAEDNSGNLPHILSNYNPGDYFSLGITNVLYKATDDDNNPNDTCSFYIEIIDTEAPVISNCQGNTSLPTDYRLPTRATTWDDVILFDNSLGNIESLWNIQNGSVFVIGATRVFLTATDESGNEAICEFYLHIFDEEVPVLICPDVSPVPNTFRLPTGIVVWSDPVVTDNSGLEVTLTPSFPSGSALYLGNTVVDYNGTDPFGNIGNCSFVVTVEDIESPFFTFCPNDTSESSDPGERTTSVTWQDPVAEDNSGNPPHIFSNYNPGDHFSLGITTVIYKATDDDNNPNDTCSFDIEIADYEPPIIYNCPANISLPTDYRMPTRNTTWNDVVLFDNSLGNIEFWWNRDNGTAFEIGSTRVYLTARDEADNEAICEFYIHIYDDEIPKFTFCPSDIYLSTKEGEFDAVAIWNVSTAIDNSDIPPLVESINEPNERFGIGISTVTYYATDNFTNVNSCSFKIYVFDNENPQFITCPPDVVVNNEFRQDGAVVSWTEPIVFDNSLTDLIVTSTYESGNYFILGLTPVEYKVVDNNNNTAFCYFNVTVNDNEAPTFQNCPTNFSQSTDHRLPSAVVVWTPPTSQDNSGVAPNVTSNHNPEDTFSIGTHLIRYWSVDLTGNLETCTFYLLVFDDEPPVFTFCPENIILNPMFFRPSAVANWSQPTVEDNSLTVDYMMSNYNSSDVFPIGETWVIYQAFDRVNNSEICSFSVTVIDIAPPIWYNCSENFIVTTDYRRPDVNISWIVPNAIDDSGYSPDIICNYKPGDILPLGVTSVSYTATDQFHNSAICSFSVTVIDEEPPYFIDCPIDFVFFVDDTVDIGFPDWPIPNVTDNSGIPPMVSESHKPLDEFPVNSTLVNYTAIDDSDNVGSCQFYVTLLHAFNYLSNLNFENTTTVDVSIIVEVSVTAVNNLEGRKLDEEEEEILLSTLDVLLLENVDRLDQETSRDQVIGATTISEALIQPIQNKPLETQLEIVTDVEEILLSRTSTVLNNATFTYQLTDVVITMHPVQSKDNEWFHFYKESGYLYSKKSGTKTAGENGKASVKLKSDGLADDDSLSLMMSYFDRSVFKSSSAKETVEYFQLQSGDKTKYQLQSGILACKVLGNKTRYSTAIEFSMVVDIKDGMVELLDEAICAFWNELTKRWSDEGCERVSSGVSEIVNCYCSHTTIFGILLPTELEDESGLFSIMLRVVTYSVGLLSVVSLSAVAYVILHKRRKKIPFDPERTGVMINLIIAALMMTLCYMCTLELGGITLACIISGLILEYLYIAMIMWIFVDVFNIFSKLYDLKSTRTGLYYLALGWGFSAFVTFLFFGTYRGYDDSDGCWTDMEVGVIAAFATPTLLILLASAIMLLVCLTCKTKLKGKRRENYIIQSKGVMRCIFVFLPLLIGMWALSIQVSESDTYKMLFFGIFALHGVFVSCYCYYNFRHVLKARSPLSIHTVEEKNVQINDDINAADDEAIMKSGSITSGDRYDDIDVAIENQLARSNTSLQSRARLSKTPQKASLSSIKIPESESPREDAMIALPGAIEDLEETTNIDEGSNHDKEKPDPDSSDEESDENDDLQDKDENKEESESSDEEEKSVKEASSSDSESDVDNQDKLNDHSDDDDDDGDEDNDNKDDVEDGNTANKNDYD